MVALINEDQSKFFDVDSGHFSAVLNMSCEEEDGSEDDKEANGLYHNEPFFAIASSNESTTLKLPHNYKYCPKLTTKGTLKLMNHCNSIRELSLSYSSLSDELLKALVKNETSLLETLRIEAHSEAKPTKNISFETWCAFASRFPKMNLVLLSYLTETEDYDALLLTHVPLTHLYFGENAPSSAITSIGDRCPRLEELVIGSYDEILDEALIKVAKGCPRLIAIGLGDCELTCSGFIKFVSLCSDRLQILYVLETSLLEDSEYNVSEVSEKVSCLLGKSWQPNYVPYW